MICQQTKRNLKACQEESQALSTRRPGLFRPRLGQVGSDFFQWFRSAAVGADNYRKNYEEFLAQYEGPMDYEFRGLHITTGDGVAFIHCLERLSGTLKNGQKSEVWVRVTSGLRKINGRWRIVYDHVSVPADFETGKALLELKP